MGKNSKIRQMKREKAQEKQAKKVITILAVGLSMAY